jgi:hypothetical protein
MQVRLLPDALVSLKTEEQSARSSIGTGRRPLKPQRRVRFPHGSLTRRREKKIGGKKVEAPASSRWRLARLNSATELPAKWCNW